ncbi:carbon-nitrogen hydrolase family protein [Salinisphaera sp. USBA-960]|uniref:carbon-nitrogen hydrolase family protein n=1 Tax=Salinisphaera orenii TaxID=856731 RepID=UPI000DBE0FBC|nr:carbon-nitrogen hydrolase family protein [Salifodinibacter halophilus]NNC25558.1 carbon-nitrogen hydrolase family protein [Salifodinibacter halophilus]
MTDSANRSHVAAIQMVSIDDVQHNLGVAGRLVSEAAADGASLIVLPENFAFMGRRPNDYAPVGEVDGNGQIQSFLATTAAAHGIWLVGGSIPLASGEAERVIPSCLVYDPNGRRAARYDKIHLFDIGIPGSTEAYRESAMFVPGPPEPRIVDTDVGRLGLTICYDLRFPALYRALADAGAEIVVAPSAFTDTTGQAHWHVLTRARAIENQFALIAPDQAGVHADGRRTYGHSLIVDPWGSIKVEAATDEAEVITTDLDLDHVASLRSRFPTLEHRRMTPTRPSSDR